MIRQGRLKLKVCPAKFSASLDNIHRHQARDLWFGHDLSTPVTSEYREMDLPVVACRGFTRVNKSEVALPLQLEHGELEKNAATVTNVVMPTRRFVQLDGSWSDYPTAPC